MTLTQKLAWHLLIAPWRGSLCPWHVLPKSIFVYLGAWATQESLTIGFMMRAMSMMSAWPVAFDLRPPEGLKTTD